MNSRAVRACAVSFLSVMVACSALALAGRAACAIAAEAARPVSTPRMTSTPRATSTSRATSTPRPAANAPVRRLEDFRIEGEIPAPQVLFVTARDPYRFAEFQHRRYLKGSLALGQETVLPARFALVGNGPFPVRKETAP